MTKKLDLAFRQGETFVRVIRWESPPFIYKAITAIEKSAPVRITAVNHGLKTGWRCAVINVVGMTEINALDMPAKSKDYHQVTVMDVDTIAINSISSASYSTYTSGGYLEFYTPVDLTGYHARMKVKNKVGGDILLTLTDEAPDNRILLDSSANTITILVSAGDTAALTWKNGVYDLELVAPTSVVTTLFSGSVTVTREVTT